MQTQSLINELHNTRWRDLLLSQLDETATAYARHAAFSGLVREAEKIGQLESELAPDAHDCELLVRIGLVGDFPPREPWRNPGSEILIWLWTLRHASFARTIEQHYGAASDDRRGSALVLLCCQESAAATHLMVKLIREYGLPEKLAPRFFWELNKRHTSIAPQLFPEFLFRAGAELAGVMNYLNVSLEAGSLAVQALQPAADWVCSEAERLLGRVEPLQRSDGTKWRTAEEYVGLRSHLGVHLDLLGIIPGVPMQSLNRAAQLKDPGLVLFAMVSMLKRDTEPAREAIELCAKSHETRADLYRQLKFLNKIELFPREFLTFESFAAAAMTEWLRYPAELGYEPCSLELVAEVEGIKDGETVVMCLWKFTDEGGEAFACASGPYPASRPIEPLWGEDTFSNFTEWQKLTPEQHLEGILGTLKNWKIAWREGRM